MLTDPTAAQKLADGQDTPAKLVEVFGFVELGFATVVSDHEVPFHSSARGSEPALPTAMQNDAEAHETEKRRAPVCEVPDGTTGVELVHVVPSHVSPIGLGKLAEDA